MSDANRQEAVQEQEGCVKTNTEPGVVLRCGTMHTGHSTSHIDFRGWMRGGVVLEKRAVEWETSPPESKAPTRFVWIGGSQVRPAMQRVFPYVTARLFVGNAPPLRFPLGAVDGFKIEREDLTFEFEQRRFESLVLQKHRVLEASGISGLYRLTLSPELVTPGRPLKLRVELNLDEIPGAAEHKLEALFYVSPRNDALKSELSHLRSEVKQLQHDLVTLTKSHEMLYAQVYPELFPDRVRGERTLVTQDNTKHFHPATISVMSDGEVVVTFREGTDHLATDGRMVIVRSKDNGKTWGPREVLFDKGNSDHRCAPIVELPSGEWVTTDYRAGSIYTKEGELITDSKKFRGSTLWSAWSSDRGRSWEFSEKPIVPPDAVNEFAEVERHMIRLPSGRLLVGAIKISKEADLNLYPYGTAIFCSDDNARTWKYLGAPPQHPAGPCEHTLLLGQKEGRVIMMSRSRGGYHTNKWKANGPDWTSTGGLFQSVSNDYGKTWSEFKHTNMPSLDAPAHLLRLKDGRIVCTHAARAYPGSVYITLSNDDGETWDTKNSRIITNDLQNWDSTYPTTGQCADGSLITVWYANLFGKFYVPALKYPCPH